MLGSLLQPVFDSGDTILIDTILGMVRARFAEVLGHSRKENVNNAALDEPVSATSANQEPQPIQTANGIYSFLHRRHIKQKHIHHRNFKSQLCTDVILLKLLANEDTEVELADLLDEFVRLGIPETRTSLVSRLYRLRRKANFLSAADETVGVYKLTDSGRQKAELAKRKRVVDDRNFPGRLDGQAQS